MQLYIYSLISRISHTCIFDIITAHVFLLVFIWLFCRWKASLLTSLGVQERWP